MPDVSDPVVQRLRTLYAESVERARATREAAEAGDPEAMAIMEAERHSLDRRITEPSASSQARTFQSYLTGLDEMPEPEPIDWAGIARRMHEAIRPKPPTWRERTWSTAKRLAAFGGWTVGLLSALHALGAF